MMNTFEVSCLAPLCDNRLLPYSVTIQSSWSSDNTLYKLLCLKHTEAFNQPIKLLVCINEPISQ